ncbi:MAG: helix-turn-helix domain-containing protein [Thermoguttaceae bacterium]
MPNLAAILREEVCRLAKREIKRQTAAIRQAVVQYRRDIAGLKRQVREQAKEIAFLKAQERKRLGQPAGKAEESLESVRFSPRSVKAQRHRLRLSAAEYGKLVGVSGLTIYHWEHGQARPRKERLSALVAIRGLGRREALAKLALLKAGAKKNHRPAAKAP